MNIRVVNAKITDISWEFRLNPYLYKKMIDSSCPSSKGLCLFV